MTKEQPERPSHAVRPSAGRDERRDPEWRDAQALTTDGARLRALYEAVPAGVIVQDGEGRVLHANPAAIELLRLAPEAALGAPRLAQLWHLLDENGDPLDEHSDPSAVALRTGAPVRNVICGLGPAAEEGPRWLLINAQPIVAEPGQPAHEMLLGFIDITERERIRAGARQADRLTWVGRLAAGVAHEINNSLVAMLNNLDHLRVTLPAVAGEAVLFGDAGPEADRGLGERLERIHDRLQRLGRQAEESLSGAVQVRDMVRGLGALSHAEESRRVPLSVNSVLDGAALLARHEVNYRAQLVKEYGDVPAILADEGSLVRVFLSLIIAAAHALDESRHETNRLRIRTRATQGGVVVEVEAIDCGGTVAPSHHSSAAQPLLTTDLAENASAAGLALCKEIVERYHGSCTVETTEGQGTCFRVSLPRAENVIPRSAALGERSPLDSGAVHTRDAPAPTVRRFLVVDDEELILDVIRRLLLREHTVVTCRSAEKAMDLLRVDTAFDLVICDLTMPGVSGVAFFEWLVDVRPQLADRVLFMTGGAFTSEARDFLKDNDVDVVEKPLSPERFHARVHTVLTHADALSSSPGRNR